jgi:hypothetical protein
MAIPSKGTRRIVVDGVAYRWRVAYDRSAWDKGLLSDVRIVVQAVDPPGQLLLADFTGGYKTGDALSNPFTPGFVRMLILAGIDKGWRPQVRIHRPVEMDEAEVRLAAEQAS